MGSLPLTLRKLRRSLIRRCTRLRLERAGLGMDALEATIVVDEEETPDQATQASLLPASQTKSASH